MQSHYCYHCYPDVTTNYDLGGNMKISSNYLYKSGIKICCYHCYHLHIYLWLISIFFKRTIFYKTLYVLLFLVVTVVTSDFDLEFCQTPSGLMPVTTKAVLVVTRW
jgi:hypothetical protein